MTLTHHPVRLFRLSCGCLRAYPMMPAGTQHAVLCTRCRAAAMTVLAYPERCCGARGSCEGYPLSCTEAGGHASPWHFDTYANAEFRAAVPRLARSREGKTGRA